MGVVHGGRQMVIPDMGLRVRAPRSAAAPPWWQVAGKTCVAAYQPKGAASYAASKVNLANPGTYDAAEGVAPAWASATGWTFNGTTQWLTTGVFATHLMTVIARFSNGIADTAVRPVLANTGTPWYGLWQRAGTHNTYFHNGRGFYDISGITAGVMGMTPTKGYLNGSEVKSLTAPDAFTGSAAMSIADSQPSSMGRFAGDIAAIAIYAEALDDTQMATVSAAMAAL